MRKIILVALFLVINLQATKFVISKDDVVLSVNGTSKKYKVGSYNEPNVLQVCFDSGNGEVKINSVILSSTNIFTKCMQIPQKQKVMATITDKLHKLFIDGGDESKAGVTKSVTVTSKSNIEEINIPKEEKLFSIFADIGPTPIILTIFDNNNKVVSKMKNDTDGKSIFIIQRDKLKTGYRIKITDYWDDIRLDVKITLDDTGSGHTK
ncbi:MAG: hypothetical protein U9N59_16000 [Campylobacterota bacterium]|nr:hypothetical protein [Campylobacterota bacterium]